MTRPPIDSLKQAMNALRPCREEDLPGVANLHMKAFRRSGEPAPESLISRFEEIFFGNPWYDASMPSLLSRDSGGRILGFLGVIPRPMSLNGHRVQAATSTQFMVDPDAKNPLVALSLLRKFFSGAQDLSLADEANFSIRRIWEAAGGKTALLYSLRWIRPLRPLAYLSSLALRHNVPISISWASKWVCHLFDAVAVRMPKSPVRQQPSLCLQATFDSEIMHSYRNGSLVSNYDQNSIAWLLQALATKESLGKLQRIAVRDTVGEIIGCYLYFLNPGGVCQVVQIEAKESSLDEVLQHLFYHAWRAGAVALSGRVAPQSLQTYADHYCVINQGYNCMLFHSHNPEVLQSILSGEASLNRLDGEWWIPFVGERFD